MEVLASGIFYLFIILSTTISSELSVRISGKVWRDIFKWITILIPSITAGIRLNVGTDYNLYQKGFQQIINNETTRYEDFEIGYKFVNKLVAFCNGNFHWVMFIMSFFTILFIYKALYNERKNIRLSYGMMTYMFLFYQTSLNIVRQSLAISICIYALTCIYTKSVKRYILYIILASLFHKSALICLPVVFIKVIFEDIKYKYIRYIVYTLLLLLVFNKNIIGTIVLYIFNSHYYAGYFLRETDKGGNILLYLIKILPFIMFGLYKIKYINNSKSISLYFNLMICGYILGMLGCFSLTQVQRVAFYFTYLIILLVPFILKNIQGKKYLFFKITLVSFVIFIWYFDFFYKGYSQTVPYNSIICNSISSIV